MNKCVEKFSEGRNAWQMGIGGFFLRLRSLVPSTIITFLTMGVPIWWPSAFEKSVSIPTLPLIWSSVSFFGFSWMLMFIFVRWRVTRSLNIKSALHTLAHDIRDEQNKIYRRTLQNNQGYPANEDERLYEYFDRLSNSVKRYFDSQVEGNVIAAGIRLAVEVRDSKPTKIVYATFGRSAGLSSKRAETSEDIPSYEGIPRFLIDSECQGILIYNDIDKAVALNAFKKTKNDDLYKGEIVTMMVAPLNAWDGNKTSMIGILYVTSRKKNTFKEKNVDSMRFAADIVASSIAFTVNTLKNEGRITGINRRGI